MGGATNDERENQIAEAIDINGGDNQIEERKNAQINILMKNHENAIKRLWCDSDEIIFNIINVINALLMWLVKCDKESIILNCNIKYKTRKAGAFVIQYIPSGENRADIFTKGLGKTKTLHHLARLTAKRGYQDL